MKLFVRQRNKIKFQSHFCAVKVLGIVKSLNRKVVLSFNIDNELRRIRIFVVLTDIWSILISNGTFFPQLMTKRPMRFRKEKQKRMETAQVAKMLKKTRQTFFNGK